MRSSRAVLTVSLVVVASTAHAGLGSLLKLGKLGKAGKAASATRTVTRTARLGSGVALVSGSIAAERAGLAFATLGDDAARSAGYLARTADHEFVLVTRAGQTAVPPGEVGATVRQLSQQGSRPTVFLDRSAATSEDVLSALPGDVELRLADGATSLPVRRTSGSDGVDFVVDAASNAVDLQDYLGAGDADEDEDGSGYTVLFVGLGALGLFGVYRLLRAT